MKQCPYCKAALSDGASFCVYCMRELTDKVSVPSLASGRKKKRIRLICLILAGVMLFAAGTGTGVLLHDRASQGAGSEVTPAAVAPDPDDLRTYVYATADDFRDSRGYGVPFVNDKYCWEPWDMTWESLDPVWVGYHCPGQLWCRLYFKQDGSGILVAVNEAHQNQTDVVNAIVEHLSHFVYVQAAQGSSADKKKLYDYVMSPDGSQFITIEDKDYRILEKLGITLGEEMDYEGDFTDYEKSGWEYRTTSFPEFGEGNRFYEFVHTRYSDDGYMYSDLTLNTHWIDPFVRDYYFYFTFEGDEMP